MRLLPAEWEQHAATWIAWPVNSANWDGKMETVAWAFAEMIRAIAPGELVYVSVPDAATLARAQAIVQAAGAHSGNVQFARIPVSYGWLRDCGPQFILENNEVVIADFRFTGWALHPNYQNDDEFPQRAGEWIGMKVFRPEYKGNRFVLEGGAIDVNGAGSLLTTEDCLLNQKEQVRNPGLSREENENLLREFLGVRNIIWLGRGLAGDDTHGHVDDLARFVNRNTIVYMNESDSSDINYKALCENRERLESARLEDGSKPVLIALPMPGPIVCRGTRLPASYANFYICNAGVLVPTFNDPNDRIALGILADLFPDRPVRGIHATDLVLGRGSVHCLTRQQPVGD